MVCTCTGHDVYLLYIYSLSCLDIVDARSPPSIAAVGGAILAGIIILTQSLEKENSLYSYIPQSTSSQVVIADLEYL